MLFSVHKCYIVIWRHEKFERLGGPLVEIVLFSVHKCYIVIWRHDVISFESLETIAMQGYFIYSVLLRQIPPSPITGPVPVPFWGGGG